MSFITRIQANSVMYKGLAQQQARCFTVYAAQVTHEHDKHFYFDNYHHFTNDLLTAKICSR
jgi:hypothetical protein